MALIISAKAGDAARVSSFEACREMVFLLHGFAGRPVLLARIARDLVGAGYHVRNWAYPSVFHHAERHSQQLREEIERLSQGKTHSRIHVVGHSLGGIVTRLAFMDGAPEKLGRIVMLAPPNQGSHLARRASKLLGRWCPVLRELSDDEQSFVNRLGHFPPLEIGVIAASRDWVVSRRCTHLPSQIDHTVVSGSHVSVPFKAEASNQVLSFLRYGRFQSRGHRPVSHELASRQ